jgi:hypothetical protein
VRDLAVGEPQRAPAAGGVDGIAAAVALEGVSRAVVAPAVGFDEDALGLEDEVGFEGFDVVVDGRLRKARVAAQPQEALLELGLREGGAGVVVGERLEQLARSAVAGVASCDGDEGGDVRQADVLRLVEDAFEGAAVQGGGEVEDRAFGGVVTRMRSCVVV